MIWSVRMCNVYTLKQMYCELHTGHHRKKYGNNISLSYESHLNSLSLPFYKITIYMVISVYHVLIYTSMCTCWACINPELVIKACLITWGDTLGRLLLRTGLHVEHLPFPLSCLSPSLALLKPALWTFFSSHLVKLHKQTWGGGKINKKQFQVLI